MGKKKPTRIITPRIVQPGEGGIRPWLWLLLLVALAAWSWQVFEFGRQRAGFDASQRDQRESGLQKRILELEAERDALRASAAKFERAGQIDRAAAEGVQSDVRSLQTERAELKREVALLKSLVAGAENSMLVLSEFSLRRLDDRKYRFEAMLSKNTDDDEAVSGQVIVNIGGELEGEDAMFGLKELTGGKRTHIGIRFKSFQKLRTDLRLPEGFDPTSIEVTVRPDGKKFKSFEQTYDWRPSDA